MEEDNLIDISCNSDWWTSLSEDEFQLTFRMSRKSFISLQAELDNLDDVDNEETDHSLLACLWLMGNSQPFLNAAYVFSIDKDVEAVMVNYFKKIMTLGESYLCWPDVEEAQQIEKSFAAEYNFLGVVGVIGSLHMKILPINNQSDYYNTETKKHTIILQVVCDNYLILRDVCAGCPGGKSIENILKSSPLYAKLIDNDGYLVKNNKHLLGGTQHPQLKTLLTPYKGEYLDERQTKFNEMHNAAMYTVEKTLICLKNRFPRLTNVDLLTPNVATLLVSAACVLHNFTRVRNDHLNLYS